MNIIIKRVLDVLDRAGVFGKRPGLTSKQIALFAIIANSAATLRDWGVGQITGHHDYNEGVTRRQELRQEIRVTLREMADLAKSMEIEGQIGMSDLFRCRKYTTYEALLATAESFADRAEPMADEFIERGMPADFVAQLRGKIAAFRAATGTKYHGKASRAAGTEGMREAARVGLKALQALRPIMRIQLKSDPALQAAWIMAARVERSAAKVDIAPTQDNAVEQSESAGLLEPASMEVADFPEHARGACGSCNRHLFPVNLLQRANGNPELHSGRKRLPFDI